MGGRFVLSSVVVGAMVSVITIEPGRAQSVAVGVRMESAKTAVVNIDVKDVTLERVLGSIARQSGLRVFWDDRVIKHPALVSMHVQGVSAEQAFAKALAGTGIRAVISANDVVFVKDVATTAMAQGSITGKVVDAKTRQGLRGVTITLDGTHKGTTSGDDGHFRLADVAPGSHTIHARMLGYVKASQAITVTDDRTASVEIVLESSVSTLDQVVVTGTVVPTERRAVPNAMTVITAKDIEERAITQIQQLFRGDVPGLFAKNEYSANALDEVQMNVRGGTSGGLGSTGGTAGGGLLKTYVDGVEITDFKFLSHIAPSSIERIEILSGPQASTIYGADAINGVMQIFTKRGTTSRPQVNLSLRSGVVQNNMSSAVAPSHSLDATVSGREGHLNFNVGSSVLYNGSWTPSKRTTGWSVFGATGMEMRNLSTTLSARYGVRENVAAGDVYQPLVKLMEQGELKLRVNSNYDGLGQRIRQNAITNNIGVTVGYAPYTWWSHQLVVGLDGAKTQEFRLAPAQFESPSDSLLYWQSAPSTKTSQRYSTTLNITILSDVKANITVGGDHWRTISESYSGLSSTSLTATLNSPSVNRNKPSKGSGGFVQGQLSLFNSLFLTQGARIDFNPNYGEKATVVPGRWGASYVRDIGSISVKMRGSYGRSLRPPTPGRRDSVPASTPNAILWFGQYNSRLANPYLGPEFQQGFDGGVELYFGSRATLLVTRYNQTVEGLIVLLAADSVRSRLPYAELNCGSVSTVREDGYCYSQVTKYINGANIRNQGWEFQGSLNLHGLTFGGTYSWTKSRNMGLSEEYKALVPGLARERTIQGLPEHTWAFNVKYDTREMSAGLYFHGIGQAPGPVVSELAPSIYRILNLSPEVTGARYNSAVFRKLPAYVTSDLNVVRRLSFIVDATLTVKNLTNFYQSDNGSLYATPGRNTNLGIRMRF